MVVVGLDKMEFVDIHTDAGGVGIAYRCPMCDEHLVWSHGMWWELECNCGKWKFDIRAELVKDGQDG